MPSSVCLKCQMQEQQEQHHIEEKCADYTCATK